MSHDVYPNFAFFIAFSFVCREYLALFGLFRFLFAVSIDLILSLF